MIRKSDKGWKVDIRPEGRNGHRVRRIFPSKSEALRYEAHIKSKATQGEWNPKPADNRRLSDLVDIWHQGHGQHLKDGSRRLTNLLSACELLRDPIARNIKAADYTKYRDQRIRHGITPKTCNNELGYINAVFNELRRTEIIDYENPLRSLRPIKISERELTWLTLDQIQELLDSIDSGCENPHVSVISRICLSTGARWGEAEGLKPKDIREGMVTFNNTKGGRNRSIPIEPELFSQLGAHLKKHKQFSSSITAFRRALDRCSFQLPKGQASHVLRHSFASHFIMSGGNILTLQRILGHASITMTMRYSHLSPEHLQEAIKLNPLKKCGHFVDTEEVLES